MLAGLDSVWVIATLEGSDVITAGDGASGAIATVDIGVTSSSFADVESVEYAANGDVVRTVRPPVTSWTDAVPETIAELALTAFCKTPFAR